MKYRGRPELGSARLPRIGSQRGQRALRITLPRILAGIAEKSAFPFCSERCRQVDLLRWSKGEYQIVEPLAPPAFEEEASSSEE